MPTPGSRVTPEVPVLDTPPLDDDAAEETGPVRRCAVTRERFETSSMIRFVVGPDGAVVPDLSARLPGRGIWLSARGDVIETACAKGAFAKAARARVTVPRDLPGVLRNALARRVCEHLGLARRAGQAVAGFQKAREWLEQGRAGLIVQATDGSPDERARFLGSWAARVPVVTPLDGQTLGAVFGRDHVVHIAVAAGRLAESLRHEADRLTGIMSDGRTARATAAPHMRSPRAAGRNDDAGDVLSRADELKADK